MSPHPIKMTRTWYIYIVDSCPKWFPQDSMYSAFAAQSTLTTYFPYFNGVNHTSDGFALIVPLVTSSFWKPCWLITCWVDCKRIGARRFFSEHVQCKSMWKSVSFYNVFFALWFWLSLTNSHNQLVLFQVQAKVRMWSWQVHEALEHNPSQTLQQDITDFPVFGLAITAHIGNAF